MDRKKVIALASAYFSKWDKVRGKDYADSLKKYGGFDGLDKFYKQMDAAFNALLLELGPLKRAIAIPLPKTKFILVVKKNGNIYLYDSI